MYTPFSIAAIREKARQTMNETKGIYLLAVLPALLALTVNIFSQFGTPTTLYPQDNMTPDQLLGQLSGQISFPLLVSILSAFLLLSTLFTLMQVARQGRQEVSFKDALTIFNHQHFAKILKVYLIKGLFLLLFGIIEFVGIVLFISGAIIAVMGMFATDDTATVLVATGLLFFGIGVVLTLIGIGLYWPQVYAYSLTEILLYQQLEEGTFTGARALLKESRRLMVGYKWQRFVLDLTFIGWHLLTIVSGGIASIYTTPYYQLAQIYFYDALQADRQQKGLL